jgi:CpeS-like protein
MTIQNFLEMSAGKWFSQRTSHQLISQQSAHGSSDIVIEVLAASHPQISLLCQQHQIDSSQVADGIQVIAQTAPQWNAPKNALLMNTTTVLVPLILIDQNSVGQLLWTTNGQHMSIGKFEVGADESLTLFLSTPSMQIEERIWFASPNLRLRTSVQKSSAGWSLASFCSEIRMGGQPSAA